MKWIKVGIIGVERQFTKGEGKQRVSWIQRHQSGRQRATRDACALSRPLGGVLWRSVGGDYCTGRTLSLDLWEAVEAQLRSAPNMNPAVKRLQRLLIGNANDLELDNNGRFVIPPLLREHAGLDKKVMLVGQINKFELWSEEAWTATTSAYLDESQDTGELPVELHSLSL